MATREWWAATCSIGISWKRSKSTILWCRRYTSIHLCHREPRFCGASLRACKTSPSFYIALTIFVLRFGSHQVEGVEESAMSISGTVWVVLLRLYAIHVHMALTHPEVCLWESVNWNYDRGLSRLRCIKMPLLQDWEGQGSMIREEVSQRVMWKVNQISGLLWKRRLSDWI